MSAFQTRKTDYGLFMTIITLIGALYVGFGKPAAWDQTTKEMEAIKPIVASHEIQLATLKQREDDHFTAIMVELKSINKKVGR